MKRRWGKVSSRSTRRSSLSLSFEDPTSCGRCSVVNFEVVAYFSMVVTATEKQAASRWQQSEVLVKGGVRHLTRFYVVNHF